MEQKRNNAMQEPLPVDETPIKDWLFKTFAKPTLLGYFKLLNKMCYFAAGGNKRPIFYDVKATYPSLQILQDNVEVIKAEFEQVLKSKANLPRYHELDDIQQEISETTQNDWKVFMLEVAGVNADVGNRCPKTRALLQQIPHVNQAFFSILDPKKSVPAHDGPYCGYLRYHLGLRVPKNNPPQIRILDEYYTWQQDKGVLFDDSYNHEVINDSDEIRAVLLVDVLRPMPAWLHRLNVDWTRFVGLRYSKRLQGRIQQNDYTI